MSAMLDYMQLCRLCLVKEKVNVPIFGDESDVRQIFLKITACLPVKVAQEDNLPKKICDACLYKVDLLYQFWNTTVNAEKQLIQWLTEIGVDVNIKNSDTQTLPILPQSHAHPHSIPVVVPELKEERPEIVEKQPEYQIPEQPNMYPSYDNLGYPQAEVTLEVGTANTFVQPEPVEDPPPPEPPAPTPKKRGRPAGVTNKKSPPKKKATPAPPPVVVSPRTNSTRRSSATAAAAAVAAAAAAATDSEEDSDGDRLGGMDYEDSDSDEDHIPKEEMDSDEDYVKPKSFLGVPSSADGEQPGPSGLGVVKGEGSGANATESGYFAAMDNDNLVTKPNFHHTLDKNLLSTDNNTDKKLSSNIEIVNDKNQQEERLRLKCIICSKTFRSIKTLKAHLRNHTNIFRPKCDVCLKQFHGKAALKIHKLTYPPEKDFACTECDKRFHSRKKLDIHNYIEKKDNLSCYDCKQQFNDSNKLKKHVNEIHNPPNKDNQCDICGKTYLSLSARNKHVDIDHLKLCKICDICGKQLSNSVSLRDHMLWHIGDKPITCEHCGRTFGKRTTLTVHLRTHSGVKPFECNICNKKFSQNSSLKIHKRRHTGEKPYECSLCDAKFVSRCMLNNHNKFKHKVINNV